MENEVKFVFILLLWLMLVLLGIASKVGWRFGGSPHLKGGAVKIGLAVAECGVLFETIQVGG